MSFLWRKLEERIQAIITDRLIAFHAGMIERGEITRRSLSVPSAQVIEFSPRTLTGTTE